MALTLSRFFVEAPGNTIFAANWNGEFDSLITGIAAGTVDVANLSNNVAAFKVTEDPGELGTELLPVTLLGEFRRYRFALAESKFGPGTSREWYESPSGVPVNGPASSTDEAIVRYDGTGGDLVQNSGVTITDTSEMTIGDGTGTGTIPDLTINKDTGDASIRLQVDNSSATAWDLKVDNSDSDRLEFDFNAINVSALSTVGDLSIISNDSSARGLLINQQSTGDAVIRLRVNGSTANEWIIRNDNSDSDDLHFEYNSITILEVDSTSGLLIISDTGGDTVSIDPTNIAQGATPTVDRLFPNTIVKAWANTASAGTINDGVGLSVARPSTGVYNYILATAMANTSYAVVSTSVSSVASEHVVVSITSTTAFTIRTFANTDLLANSDHHLMVIGEQ